MPGTLIGILLREEVFDLHYVHRAGTQSFELDTAQIRHVLGDVPLTHPQVREWLREFITQGEQQLKEN
jgi:hypothetical protein